MSLGKKVIALAASVAVMSGAAQAAFVGVTNGDFEAGNTGFTTGLTEDSILHAEGTYKVTSTPPQGWLDNFSPDFVAAGNALVVNATSQEGVSFWSQSVELGAGKLYKFSGNVADLTFAPPVLELFVNGVSAGTFAAADGLGAWEEFMFSWTSNVSGSVVLALVNNTTVRSGADFAIDNLKLVETPLPGALPLMASGIAAGWFARRRKKAEVK